MTGPCGVEQEGARRPRPLPHASLFSASLHLLSPCAVLDRIPLPQGGLALTLLEPRLEPPPKGPLPSWARAVLRLSIISKSSSFS